MTPRTVLSLLLLVWMGGCDMPADPEATNPYDPAFEGPRTLSPPLQLRVTASTPTSVTLEWEESSSFESAYHVERSVITTRQQRLTFEAFRTLPSNTTQLVLDDFPAGEYYLRMLTEDDEGRVSAPGNHIIVAHTTDRYYSFWRGSAIAAVFSGDGSRLYRRLGRLQAWNPSADRSEGTFPSDYTQIARTATDRSLIYEVTRGIAGLIRTTSTDVTPLTFEVPCCREIAVDPSGSFVAAASGDDLHVVDPSSGATVGRYNVSALANRSPLRALSTDGHYAVFAQKEASAAASLAVVDLQTEQVAWQTSGSAYVDAHISPDGRYLLTGRAPDGNSAPFTVELRDLRTGALVDGAATDLLATRLYGFSSDGSFVAYHRKDLKAAGLARTLTLEQVKTVFAQTPLDVRPLDGPISGLDVVDYDPLLQQQTMRRWRTNGTWVWTNIGVR